VFPPFSSSLSLVLRSLSLAAFKNLDESMGEMPDQQWWQTRGQRGGSAISGLGWATAGTGKLQ